MATKLVSVVTGGSNSHQTSSAEINGIATDFISQGVVGAVSNTSGVAPSTGAFAVNAIGTPNMSVRVTNGYAYVTATPTGGTSQTFRVSMDATEDVTIAANATGGTRYDWIYLKLDADKLVNPAVAADDVFTLAQSRSTSASTDNGTPPTYGYAIAVVTVANGATSITNGNITDSRVQTGAKTTSAQAASGMAVQSASVVYSSVATGTTILPLDDTIPQNTEGDQYMTLAITPKSATNTLIIDVQATAANSAAAYNLCCALFQDSTAGALAAQAIYSPTAGGSVSFKITHTMTAGTTSATTFKVRIGANVAGTTSFNGQAGARIFGAISKSAIVITEYKA